MLTGRLKKELIGAELKVVTKYLVDDQPVVHHYTIFAVHPCCVSAIRFAENGTKIIRSFSIGDLVVMGIIEGGGKRDEEE